MYRGMHVSISTRAMSAALWNCFCNPSNPSLLPSPLFLPLTPLFLCPSPFPVASLFIFPDEGSGRRGGGRVALGCAPPVRSCEPASCGIRQPVSSRARSTNIAFFFCCSRDTRAPTQRVWGLGLVEVGALEQGMGLGAGGVSHLRKLECVSRPPDQCWDPSNTPPLFTSFLVFLHSMSLLLAALASSSQLVKYSPGQGWLSVLR